MEYQKRKVEQAKFVLLCIKQKVIQNLSILEYNDTTSNTLQFYQEILEQCENALENTQNALEEEQDKYDNEQVPEFVTALNNLGVRKGGSRE